MKITIEKAIELLCDSTAVIVNDYEVLFPDVLNDEEFLVLEEDNFDAVGFLKRDNSIIEFDKKDSSFNLISSKGDEYQIQLLQVGHRPF